MERELARWNVAPTLRPPGPAVALRSLLSQQPPRALAAPGTLAKLPPLHVGRSDRRLSPLDVSWRVCPPELVASHLAGAQRAAWQRASDARRTLREEFKRRMVLQRLERECATTSCPDAACFREWLRSQANVVVPELKVAWRHARDEAIAQFEGDLKRRSSTRFPHTSFALAALVDDAMRESEDEPSRDVLDRLVALLRVAADDSERTTPFGWYARYELGRALSQQGHDKEATAAWATIEHVTPPETVSEIEAAWRIAQTTTTGVAPAWERVALRCPLPQEEVDVLCPAAAYQWMASAYEQGAWRKAIDAAARLLTYAEQVDDGMDVRQEAYTVLANSLDALGGDDLDRLPSIPAGDAPAVTELASEMARARTEVASLEGELTTRMSALVTSCLEEGDEGLVLPILVRVRIERGGEIRVQTVPERKARPSDAARACLARRGAWFFRDVRSGVEINVR